MISFFAQDKLVERFDTLRFGAAFAAGARHMVVDAFETGAILQHRFERVARETRDVEKLETLIDGLGMTGMDDFGNARIARSDHRLAARADADADRALMPFRFNAGGQSFVSSPCRVMAQRARGRIAHTFDRLLLNKRTALAQPLHDRNGA